jgi:uncharacterized Zn ribbon protein
MENNTPEPTEPEVVWFACDGCSTEFEGDESSEAEHFMEEFIEGEDDEQIVHMLCPDCFNEWSNPEEEEEANNAKP